MNAFEQRNTEDRRLALLLLLRNSAGYTNNEFILRDELEYQHGHNVSHDRVRQDLSWLAEQGLIELDKPGDLFIAKINARGLDIAAGRAVVPGVQRPRPV